MTSAQYVGQGLAGARLGRAGEVAVGGGQDEDEPSEGKLGVKKGRERLCGGVKDPRGSRQFPFPEAWPGAGQWGLCWRGALGPGLTSQA